MGNKRIKMTKVEFNMRGKRIILGLMGGFKGRGPAIELPNMVTQINKTFKTQLRLWRLNVADHLLRNCAEVSDVMDSLPAPTSAFMAWGEIGKPLGENITYRDGELRIRVATGRHKGKENVVLMVPEIRGQHVHQVGENITIKVFDKDLSPVPEALVNRGEEPFAGLVFRGVLRIREGGQTKQVNDVGHWTTDQYGVVVEIPASDTGRVQEAVEELGQTLKMQRK